MEPFVLAITGASAQRLGERALQVLLEQEQNVHLIVSKGAHLVWESEIGIQIPVNPQLQEKFWRDHLGTSKGSLTCHKWNDQSACIASGSYKTRGMLIIPSTMGTVGRIASGISLDLIERTADVHLKESRPLLICPREMPWNLIHLRNLTSLAEAGAKIAPPIPGWYTDPKSVDDIVDFIIVRIFDSFGLEVIDFPRWKQEKQ
ncbi:flavin prenyltransferase UbiX [Prochlorococcus sp. MIT 1341]|uniref:flavin prenyltransferase UbiX n=1 Tax=Prochlorococcus sp. MIT 1341 TaxID=3096221 RepID=UPI002A74DE1E|nr:flavin prenyltransferase UbiX [Prochlorococcus sp. MIT 1341]